MEFPQRPPRTGGLAEEKRRAGESIRRGAAPQHDRGRRHRRHGMRLRNVAGWAKAMQLDGDFPLRLMRPDDTLLRERRAEEQSPGRSA